jgi:NAD-dependent SIR2 family protein deacetylase
LAQAEKRFEKEGKQFNVITQNVDGLFNYFIELK